MSIEQLLLSTLSAFIGATIATYLNYLYQSKLKKEEMLFNLRLDHIKEIIDKLQEIMLQFDYNIGQEESHDFSYGESILGDSGNKSCLDHTHELDRIFCKATPYISKKAIKAIKDLRHMLFLTCSMEQGMTGSKPETEIDVISHYTSALKKVDECITFLKRDTKWIVD